MLFTGDLTISCCLVKMIVWLPVFRVRFLKDTISIHIISPETPNKAPNSKRTVIQNFTKHITFFLDQKVTGGLRRANTYNTLLTGVLPNSECNENR